MSAKDLTITSEDGTQVSGLWTAPKSARAGLVLAHGAGAAMTHKGMTAIAEGLGERDVATLRFNFPYMERGSKRPDPPAIAHACVRAAVAEAVRLAPLLSWFAGGRSFGGRMTSQAQASKPLSAIRGLVFFAFPLHPAGKPAIDRADHLAKMDRPMLFLQGSRDELAQLDLLKGVLSGLGKRSTLKVIDEADHSFHVPAKTGRKDPEVLSELLDVARDWMLKRAD